MTIELPDGNAVKLNIDFSESLISKTTLSTIIRSLKLGIFIVHDCINFALQLIVNKNTELYYICKSIIKISNNILRSNKLQIKQSDIEHLVERLPFVSNYITNNSLDLNTSLSSSCYAFSDALIAYIDFNSSKINIPNATNALDVISCLLRSLTTLYSGSKLVLPFTPKDLGRAIKTELLFDPIIEIEDKLPKDICRLCNQEELNREEIEFLLNYSIDELCLNLLQSHSEDQTYTLLIYRMNPYGYRPIIGNWDYIVDHIVSNVSVLNKLKHIICRRE